MDIVGLKVVHSKFGEGVVKELQGSIDEASDRAYVKVAFKKTQRVFSYPKAFARFLTASDKKAQARILKLIEQRKEQVAEAKAALPPRPTVVEMVRSMRPRTRKADSNVAFRCAFCDGGADGKNLGFQGVCSDEMIHHNVSVEKATWCHMLACLCRQYVDGDVAREDIEEAYRTGQGPCYESAMLRNWRASAGMRANGDPITMARAHPNSLAVLTTRLPDMDETQRFIFAVFIIDEAYPGNQGKYEGDQEAGWVAAHENMRLMLPPKVAKDFLYWNYQANTRQAHVAKWGSGLFRYLSDTVSVQILKDLQKAKLPAKDRKTVDNMLAHFSQINRIDPADVPEREGALLRQAEAAE